MPVNLYGPASSKAYLRSPRIGWQERAEEALALTDPMFVAGLVLVVAGIVLIVASSIALLRSSGGKCESSGVILIGPIPIIWGTSKRVVAIMGAVTAIIILLVVLSWLAGLAGR